MTSLRTIRTDLRAWLAAGLIVAAILLAYSRCYRVPFLLDDTYAIVENGSLRTFLGALTPASDSFLSGRPVLSLSYYANYQFGQLAPWGYHVFNVALHAATALLLAAIVRRTLRDAAVLRRYADHANGLSLISALLWALHPLHTEAVTYISQRAEVLMAFFYLLALLQFILALNSRRAAWLYAGSALACVLGVLTKEVMVTCPLMILLYDRTFVSGTFRAAWNSRRYYYLSLFASWLVLLIILSTQHRSGVGFDQGAPWQHYAFTSSRSLLWYLKLLVWPAPLVFDYGTTLLASLGQAWPYVLGVLGAWILLGFGWLRRPLWAFAGIWFFVILLPVHSFVPIVGQPLAEHRVYLPSCAVVVAAAVGFFAVLGKRAYWLLVPCVVLLGALTARRNLDYQSTFALWSDTVAKQPKNTRARISLATALAAEANRIPEGIAEYQRALELNPISLDAHLGLGAAWLALGNHTADAEKELRTALQIDPRSARAHHNLGQVYAEIPGRLDDAVKEFRTAIELKPFSANEHFDLAMALVHRANGLPEAIEHLRKALEIDPSYAEARANLATALAATPGHESEAFANFEKILAEDPQSVSGHFNYGRALLKVHDRIADAVVEFQKAAALDPEFLPARRALGLAQAAIPERRDNAITTLRDILAEFPNDAETHFLLGRILLKVPAQHSDAVAHLQAAVSLHPALAKAANQLLSSAAAPTAASSPGINP